MCSTYFTHLWPTHFKIASYAPVSYYKYTLLLRVSCVMGEVINCLALKY